MSYPDVVYVVRPGERNEELRYSLRSLRNLPHGKVWIAGYKPRWVSDEVGHIPAPKMGGPHANAKANLRAACEHPDVSETFVYMNDDFFVMQPHEQLPTMHRGLLSALVKAGIMASGYNRAMKQTLELLQKRGIAEPLMYDLHAPMLVSKAGMLEALDACSAPTIQERTLYGNLQAVGGEKRHNHKVRRQDRGWSSWPFLSTNEHTFATLPVGEQIRGVFPDRCPYETDAPSPTHRVPIPHRAMPARQPVRYRSSGSRVVAVA